MRCRFTRSRARPAGLALLLALGGCAVQREAVVPVIDAAGVRLTLDPDGPWHEAEHVERPWTREQGALGAALASEPVRELPAPSPPTPAPPREPKLAVPHARGLGETTARGVAPSKPLAEVARERFLDHPTELKAQQITIYAPPGVLAEGRLTAAQVSEPTPGRRVATGEARLALRELTLTAERITVRTREGSPDIQVTARGGVQFVSRQREQVLREEGLKSLILTNDQITPLR